MSATPQMACANKLDEAIKAHMYGQVENAEALYRSVLASVPDHFQASQFLGVLLFQNGRKSEGVNWIEQAVRVNPHDPEAWSNLGNAYRVLSRRDDAIECLNRALSISPNFASALCTLGSCLREIGTLKQSIEVSRHAIRVQPNLVQAHCNLGLALLDAGEIQEAIAAFQQTLYISPDFLEAHQSLLFALQYSDEHSATDILTRAKAFASGMERIEWPVSGELKRIAFLSGDFRKHPVAFFLKLLLQNIDRSQFEVTLLSNLNDQDSVTEELKGLVTEFIQVADLTPHKLQSTCRDKKIDMVIDLAGHTASNRIDALSLRLAPVQVSWLGYSGTTGLPTMDWIIADDTLIPVEHEASYTEKAARIDQSVFCFAETDLQKIPAYSPFQMNGFVTFGSCNTLSKVSNSSIRNWAEILRRVPDSRLIIKARYLAEPRTTDRVKRLFELEGIDLERISIRGWLPAESSLDTYSQIDIAVDTHPYTGATTTVEALSTGVPVITTTGDRYASRMSASILTTLGRQEWVCDSPEAAVSKCVELAQQPETLNSLRISLPIELASSKLCNGREFARSFESCLRAIWSQSQNTNTITRAVIQ